MDSHTLQAYFIEAADSHKHVIYCYYISDLVIYIR